MAPQNIENLNKLSLTDFREQFWPADTTLTPVYAAPNGTSYDPDKRYNLHLYTSGTLPMIDFGEAFKLIRKTSEKQYAASSVGWHPAQKQREMRLPDLKYIVAKNCQREKCSGPSAPVVGFLSFMLTYEDGIDVIYCYEIHIEKYLRGKGFGKALIEHMEGIGRKAGVKKAMLTVFEANVAAKAFYEKLGYEADPYSPAPKKLRGGAVKSSDYLILSKSLVDDQGVEEGEPVEERIKVKDVKATSTKENCKKRKAG